MLRAGSPTALLLAVLAMANGNVEAFPIDDPAAAIEAARRYTKARCNAQTPCTYKPEREGKQWRVWVQLTKRDSPNAAPKPAGSLVLFFDLEGNLIRRLETD